MPMLDLTILSGNYEYALPYISVQCAIHNAYQLSFVILSAG